MKKQLRKADRGLVEKTTISTKTIEYDYSYEENDLVHLEMNLIELPFFNKNNKIKKNTSIIYNFNKDKTSYLQVKPGYDLCIPGEKEEKIFYALLKIFQKNNFLENKFVYTDYYEIIKEMELDYSGRAREQVKKGLEILRETHFEFQNSFYTKKGNEHHKMSFNELKKLLNITFITLDKVNSEEEKTLFTNNRREIIKVELSDFIKTNILNKIFLYFSKQDLLSLENAVTRNLWIKFTKWRNGKLFLRVSSKNIASKIPLSWTPSTYSKTIMIIKKSLEDLKIKNLIRHYIFVNMIDDKKIKNEKTYFEIYFDEVHNEKRNNFTMGKEEDYFHYEYDTSIEHIEYKPNKDKIPEITESVEPIKPEEPSKDVGELHEMVSEKGKKLSTMRGKIEKALKKNSFEAVKFAILYTNKNSKTSYGKYFTDTLENRWYEEFMQIAKSQEMKDIKIKTSNSNVGQQQIAMDFVKLEDEKMRNEIKELYSALPETEQKDIEKSAYQDYIAEAGGKSTKIIKDAFERAKLSLIVDFLLKSRYFPNNLKINSEDNIKEKSSIEDSSRKKSHEDILEIVMISEGKKELESLLDNLGDSLTVEIKAEKSWKTIEQKVKAQGIKNSIEEVEITPSEEKKDTIKIEKIYDDIIAFKIEIHDYLFDKISEKALKQIVSFLNIESHYRREVENYKIEAKYDEGEKSFIHIEKV